MIANELRIGNLLKLYDTGELFTVTGLMQQSTGVKVYGITGDGTYCNLWIEHCEPIPIAPELLEMLSLKKQKQYYVIGFHNSKFSGLVKLKYDKILNLWVVNIGSYVDITRVGNIHELQNVIFALTGEELTIKPN